MTKLNPQNRRLGYARVSTYRQTFDAQLDQLRRASCAKTYRGNATGARPDRRGLLNFLNALGPGGVERVTRIDRLARSTFDLFAIVKQIDTIRTLTAEGRIRAKALGHQIGRPPKFTPQQQQKEARWWRPAGASLKELAESYSVGRATFTRLSNAEKGKRPTMIRLAFCLCGLLFLSVTARASEDHWETTFLSGNPYQIAARCYAAGMYYPKVWSRGDEDRALMEIMDGDPHLNAELTRQHFDIQPGARLNLFTVVLGAMYLVAWDFRRYPLDVLKVRTECNLLLNAHGYATSP